MFAQRLLRFSSPIPLDKRDLYGVLSFVWHVQGFSLLVHLRALGLHIFWALYQRFRFLLCRCGRGSSLLSYFAASLNCLNSYWLQPPAVFPAARHAQVIQTKVNSWCHSSHRASQRSLKSVNNCCCFCVTYLCTFAQGAAV